MTKNTKRTTHSLDLSQLFIKVGGSGDCWGVRGSVVHVQIHADEHGLDELDQLQGHLKTDRNQIVVQDEKSQEIEAEIGDRFHRE